MFERWRRQFRRKPTLLDSQCEAVADWVGSNPRVPESFDEDVFLDVANDLMRVLTPHCATGHPDEMRMALIKCLVSVSTVTVLHGNDADVFELSSKFREDLYSEIMRLRRALLRDMKDGNL